MLVFERRQSIEDEFNTSIRDGMALATISAEHRFPETTLSRTCIVLTIETTGSR
jgi:hypothetical protein